MIKLAIVGCSGYKMPEGLDRLETAKLETPYGLPSTEVYTGQVEGRDVIFLSRMCDDPTERMEGLNFMANFYALRELGCNLIISTAECASLQEEICPGDCIIPDQFIDLTNHKIPSFNDVATTDHMNRKAMINPFSEDLRDCLIEAAIVQGITVHNKGTVITIDGARYATKAESNLYRNWGGDMIDMVTSREVISAITLGIPLAQVSLCTAYDSWRSTQGEDPILPYAELIREGYEKVGKIIDYVIGRVQLPE